MATNNHHIWSKKITIICSTITAIVLAFYLGLKTADSIKNVNFSDIERPLYEHTGLALGFGILTFPLLTGLFLWLICKTTNNTVLPISVGKKAFLFALPLYVPLLIFTINF
ncbi:MAG: hypothetical protein F6K47_16350 [Symploca sp. SIO2E6]|nr:hypothetical protein [Symploca sp. SIO2E6]